MRKGCAVCTLHAAPWQQATLAKRSASQTRRPDCIPVWLARWAKSTSWPGVYIVRLVRNRQCALYQAFSKHSLSRLCILSLLQVGSLQKEIERMQSSGQASSSGAAGKGSNPAGMPGAGLHSRGAARANGSAASQNASTPDQRQLVRRIIATKVCSCD